MSNAKQTIQEGKAILGIEFGSTRIKAVLIDENNTPIAQGSHGWENQLIDGLWTYSIEAIWNGVQNCYADLRANVKTKYDTEIERLASIGVSAMMHGYMLSTRKRKFLLLSVPGAIILPGKPARSFQSFFSTTFPRDGALLIYTRPF